MHTCNACGETKEQLKFGMNGKYVRQPCGACRNTRDRSTKQQCWERNKDRYNTARQGLTRRMDESRTRRARLKGATIESVHFDVVWDRDGGVCQGCREQLTRETKFPDQLSPTLDHIVPLSRGGVHAYENVQILCFKCNSSKGAN